MSNSKVDWKFYFSISGHFNHSRACKTKLSQLHRQAPSPLACLPLARPFFLAHTTSKRLLRSYLVMKVFQNGTMFVNISLFYSHTRSYVTQWTATTLCGGLSV